MIFEIYIAYDEPHKGNLIFFVHQILKDFQGLQYRVKTTQSAILLWIDIQNLPTQELQIIIDTLSKTLPYDVFMGEIQTQILQDIELGDEKEVKQKREFFPFCPHCLETQGQCLLCGQNMKVYDEEIFESIIEDLLSGKDVGITSESGIHCLSIQAQSSRAYCLNLEEILQLCNATEKDIRALASLQKPIVRIKINPQNRYGIERNEVDVSLATDLFLLGLFERLKEKKIDFLFGSQTPQVQYAIQEPRFKPLHLVILENHRPLVLESSDVDLRLQEIFKAHSHPDKAFLSTLIEEHQLQSQNILNFYFSFQEDDKISLYNSQTQWFNEVMFFVLPKNKRELFDWIVQEDENGAKLVKHYKAAFPQYCQNVQYEDLKQSVFGIWEIIKELLGMEANPFFIAQRNLDKRGVAIDYLCKKDALLKRHFLLTKCVRSAMSFRLAGVENSIIALGLIESFSLFPSRVYLSVRDLIEINGVSLCGDAFANKMLGDFFYKNNRQFPIYRNLSFPLLYQ